MDAQKYTLEPIGRRLRNLAKHVNLDNPDEVKSFIARIDTHARTRRNCGIVREQI